MWWRPSVFSLVAAVALMRGYASAQQPLDGRWQIEALPERGTCKKPLRHAVVIEHGRIRDAGSRWFSISGGLELGGRVRGTIQRSRTRIDVAGQLSGRSGSGT